MHKYYTIKGKEDGFGAQYQAIMSGIAYCFNKKYVYVHTPFTKIEHGCDVEKANDFIGIKTIDINPSNTIVEHAYIIEVHHSENPSLYYNNETRKFLRDSYYSTQKPEIIPIDIAIHIRRGDVSETEFSNRFNTNAYYAALIEKIKIKYPSYTVTIFSEGVYEDFKTIGLDIDCFRLNQDIFETFHSLVTAKVLIQAKSSFSYAAGILNSNTVYFMDGFWHNKLDDWLSIDSLYS